MLTDATAGLEGVMKTSAAVRLEPVGLSQLVARYLETRARVGRSSVAGAIQLGAILEEVAVQLRAAKRPYLLFLRLVGEDDSTAGRYRRLYRLHREDPVLVREWASLGRSKLYWIARLTREKRRRMLHPFSKAHLHVISERDFAARARKLMRPRSRSVLNEAADLCRRADATRRALGRLRRTPPGPVRTRLAASLGKLEMSAHRARVALERGGVRRTPASPRP